MERVTISMSDEFAAELSAFVESAVYANRSEALRDLARLGLQHAQLNAESGSKWFATLSYVFNHQTRELAKRLKPFRLSEWVVYAKALSPQGMEIGMLSRGHGPGRCGGLRGGTPEIRQAG